MRLISGVYRNHTSRARDGSSRRLVVGDGRVVSRSRWWSPTWWLFCECGFEIEMMAIAVELRTHCEDEIYRFCA